jgi:hypothetical protein
MQYHEFIGGSSDYSKKQFKDIIFALLLWARARTMLR